MSFTRQDWKAAIVIQKICRGKIGKMRAAFRKERNNAIVQKEILHQEKIKRGNIKINNNYQNSKFLANSRKFFQPFFAKLLNFWPDFQEISRRFLI